MPFDSIRGSRPRIAVIGGGIAGMAAAYLLSAGAEVTHFEAEPRLGGHARTVMAGRGGDQPVDTGFIVFNYATYPHLGRLFRELDVPVVRSDMSFGASLDGGRIEYGLASLPALFAQPANAGRPAFLRMLRDIHRFNRSAEAAAASDDLTIAELVAQLGLGDWFFRCYLMPICGAIWSTPSSEIGDYPARTLLRFFRNHALLDHRGQHQWWTVAGGSVEYVRRLERALRAKGVQLRLATPVLAVGRNEGGAWVKTRGHEPEAYDQMVLACHSDDALRLLDRPTQAETKVLSAIRYRDNRAVLHCDPDQMPRRRAAWSSWVYRADARRGDRGVGVTYWMNRLQNIPAEDAMFVTLNPGPIPETMIYDETVFRHPVFDRAAIRAQTELAALQGRDRVWFAGAWARHGFHEDGFASAVRIVRAMGVSVP